MTDSEFPTENRKPDTPANSLRAGHMYVIPSVAMVIYGLTDVLHMLCTIHYLLRTMTSTMGQNELMCNCHVIVT